MVIPTFSRFVYCDTNILCHLAKHRELWTRLANYLFNHDLTLAVGSQIAELSDAERLHESLAAMLITVPAAVIKPWDVVLAEEVSAHPHRRHDTLLMCPINVLLAQADGLRQLCSSLSSKKLRAARTGQRASARLLPVRLAELRPNFPPSPGGKYTRQQGAMFAWLIAVQTLASDHLKFLQQYRANVADLNERVFRSIRLSGLVVYYKYYLGGREPRRQSDFGDLSHLYAIPYCAVAIMERDLANVLQQIKRHDDVLDSTEIHDVDFFRTWPAPTGSLK